MELPLLDPGSVQLAANLTCVKEYATLGENWNMQHGFVALLDVLGFSSLVLTGTSTERLQQYLNCLQIALSQGDGPRVQFVVFSDSLVLTTEDDSDDAFKAILRRCSRAFGMLLEIDIPLRGAIAHGNYFRTETPGGVFVAGRAIVDAYDFEKIQDWVGIMLAPSVIKHVGVEELKRRCRLSPVETPEQLAGFHESLQYAAFVQPCAEIPFHSDAPSAVFKYDGFAIVPTDGVAVPGSLATSIRRSLQALSALKSLAPHPLAQAKYLRSYNWLQNYQGPWQGLADRMARDS